MVNLKKANREYVEITIRNITKDDFRSFNNDYTIHLPMRQKALKSFLGHDEWIIVDSPMCGELTDILLLNDLIKKYGKEDFEILSQVFYENELVDDYDFIIINFTDETSQYNSGFGAPEDDWWKGYLLHQLNYVSFPFPYCEEMEGYVKFEQLWYTAQSQGWHDIRYNGKLYLVKGRY